MKDPTLGLTEGPTSGPASRPASGPASGPAGSVGKDRRAGSSSDAIQPERRSGADRRQYERVLVDWSVDYRGSDTFLFAYISDISAMGIFVRTPTPEPAGTRLNLRFNPPGGPPMEVEAQVIWINPPRDDGDTSRQPGMGLQFVDLTPLQRDQVLRLVRTFAYLPDDDKDAAEEPASAC